MKTLGDRTNQSCNATQIFTSEARAQSVLEQIGNMPRAIFYDSQKLNIQTVLY